MSLNIFGHIGQAVASIFGSPIPQERISRPSRDSGSYRGTIANYRPRRTISQGGETAERILTQDRAEDLYANDFAAKSTIDTISMNAVGTGLMPQPRIPHKLLGISEEQGLNVKEQMEWNWAEWCAQAHANGNLHFEDLQYCATSTMLRMGELTHLPTFDQEPEKNGRTYSLAIQPLSPKRLRTPTELVTDPFVRDGVHLSPTGNPLGYWLASPGPSAFGGLDCVGYESALTSADFRYIPAHIAHRPGFFHIFRHVTEEQVRGVSALSASVKLIRNLGDAIDYELLAQVIAASFPVFIALDSSRPGLPPQVMENFGLESGDERKRSEYQTVFPGQVMYGMEGEKPEILESKRPNQNFMSFAELCLRATGACNGVSYESVLKDFSKSNYSSARAALNEDWKTYMFYRNNFARLYCQPIWNMVQEEAYLRGRLVLPSKAPGFYERRFHWLNCYWFGPSRGYVDPVKEIQANIMAIANRLMPRSEHWAQNGWDFDEGMDQIEAEEKRMARMNEAPSVVRVNKTTGETSGGDADGGDNANE